MTTQYRSASPAETEALGRRLCEGLIQKGLRRAFVALFGDMGVGKTAFARGFGAALGISGVKSPTYTVVNEHRGTPVPLFHFDMYRIQDPDDLTSIGYDDYLMREGYVLCEWSERIEDELPPDAIRVTVARTDGENGRSITVQGDFA